MPRETVASSASGNLIPVLVPQTFETIPYLNLDTSSVLCEGLHQSGIQDSGDQGVHVVSDRTRGLHSEIGLLRAAKPGKEVRSIQMRKGRPALVLVAAMLTVAGCGSSSKSSSSTPVSNAGAKATTSSQASATPATNAGGAGQALSTSELVVQADAICKQLSTELDAPKSPIRTQADIARVAPQRAALEQRAVTELSKLKPPASMARDYQEIIEARQTLVEDLTKIGEAVASNKPQAEQPIYESSATLVRKMRATAQHRGFKECGDLG